jgi:hypothetical protein
LKLSPYRALEKQSFASLARAANFTNTADVFYGTSQQRCSEKIAGGFDMVLPADWRLDDVLQREVDVPLQMRWKPGS